MDNLRFWNLLKTPPRDATKPIPAGRLKGKTDINPQWRMEVMTSVFGPVGQGWMYDIEDVSFRDGHAGQVVCFARVAVRYRIGDAWSEPVPGIGGSMFIEQERNGVHTSDEAVKMAVTDALSVALKAIGVAADVYRGHFDGKHTRNTDSEPAEDRKPGAPVAFTAEEVAYAIAQGWKDPAGWPAASQARYRADIDSGKVKVTA